MKITFLGTGTSTGVPYIGCDCEVCRSSDPRDNRLRSSLWVEVDKKNLLIDCGLDFRQQALRAGICSLDAVLLTHEHIDHVGGIDDLRPLGDMDIYADERTVKSVRHMYWYCFDNSYPGVPSITLHEIQNQEFSICGVKILPIRAYHYKLPVFGYRIKNMAYLTDFKTIDPEEKQKLQNLDLLIIDALRHKEHLSHVNLQESLEIIREVNPKKAYLIHMSHHIGLHAKGEEQLPLNVHFAYDGLVVNV